jgi:hypothetical protein
MAELKTQKTQADVQAVLATIPDLTVQRDARRMVTLMKAASRAEPAVWGSNIVGFGTYHYVYASGREGDWFQIGFAPRKKNLTLYLMGGLKAHAPLLKKLGKHKAAGSCLHITNLEDIHLPTLKALLKGSVQWARSQNKKTTSR